MPNKPNVQISPEFEKRYPDANPLATESAMNLVLTADMLVKRIAKLLKPIGLTPSGGLVLSILADSQEPLSPNQIAQRLIISRAAITSLLDSLAKKGYAKRTPHPHDHRKLVIEITRKGQKAADQFRPLIHRNQKEWFDALDEQEKREFIASLHALQSSLGK